jgi:hypothetical protein
VNAAGQILVTATIQGLPGSRELLLTPKHLQRFAYVYADQPTASQYSPDARFAENASGGAITIRRLQVGQYEVTVNDLVGWGFPKPSSVVSVTTHGSAATSCALLSRTTTNWSITAVVGCANLVTKAPADSRFSMLVTGNDSIGGPSAFLTISDSATPVVLPHHSWNATNVGPQSVTRVAQGTYNVLLGTGNTPKSAKLVTRYATAGTTCMNAKGISGGVQVKCFDANGVLADGMFTINQVAGGRSGRRLGFARANLPTTPSYTPASDSAFNSAGGAITAARSAVGRYSMTFAGLAATPGLGEHVQVAPVAESRVTCNVASWAAAGPDLRVNVECRNAAAQFVDTRYEVLVIE